MKKRKEMKAPSILRSGNSPNFPEVWVIVGLYRLVQFSIRSEFALTKECICRDAFVDYWVNGNKLTMDTATQIFTIMKQPDRKYLMQV